MNVKVMAGIKIASHRTNPLKPYDRCESGSALTFLNAILSWRYQAITLTTKCCPSRPNGAPLTQRRGEVGTNLSPVPDAR